METAWLIEIPMTIFKAPPCWWTGNYKTVDGLKHVLIISERYEIVSTSEILGVKLKGIWATDGEHIYIASTEGNLVLGYELSGDVLRLTDERGDSVTLCRLRL